MNTARIARIVSLLNLILAGITFINRKAPEVLNRAPMVTSAGTFGTTGDAATGMVNALVWFLGFNGACEGSNYNNTVRVLNACADFWCVVARDATPESEGGNGVHDPRHTEVITVIRDAFLAIVQVVSFGADDGVNGPMMRQSIRLSEAVRQHNLAAKRAKAAK